MWVVPEECPLKESISLTCVLQTMHFEVHLNVPNLVGGEESKGGTSARTIKSRRLRGRLKAKTGELGMASARRSEVWRIWWFSLVIFLRGGREGW